jgi:hypothetical protein
MTERRSVDVQSGRNERRRSRRTAAVLAVGLETARKRGRHGVTRDLSARGLLVITPSAFVCGERVEITLVQAGMQAGMQAGVHGGAVLRSLSGHVARVDENAISSPELWRYRIGIELDEPLPPELLAS